VAKGEINNAIQAVDLALGFEKSEEASALKNRLRQHLDLLNTAENQFQNGNMKDAEGTVKRARELAGISNNATALEKKINSYNQSFAQAQSLMESNPDQAMQHANAAQQLSNNQQVRQLIQDIVNNTHTVVIFTLQGYSNCNKNNAYVKIKGTNFEERIKYQPGVAHTIKKRGDFTAYLEGLGCPEAPVKDLGGGIAQSSQAVTSIPTARFTCQGGQISAVLK
jgi:hypothetical protein